MRFLRLSNSSETVYDSCLPDYFDVIDLEPVDSEYKYRGDAVLRYEGSPELIYETGETFLSAVKQLGVDVYWAGPVDGAKYTLSSPAEGQVYVRYLPNGDGLTDTKPNYVVIATYTTTNAFSATQAAGNQSNGVTFVNTEGAAVFYNKDTPTNVYVAYPNLNFQVEIFNPIAATALEIASTNGALRLVK